MSPRNAKPQPWTEEKHPASTSALLTALRHLRDKNPKAVRANVHIYPSSIFLNNGESSEIGKQRDRRITSWKMTEHMYFNASNPFPTLARGLLTEEVEDGDELPPGLGEDEPVADRIVARGYDKFFNVDEVEWTNWSSMQAHTQPPYRLTLKSNGCLILIAALSPSHLVVASKHSLGTTTEFQGAERSDTADTLVTERLHKLAIQDSGQIGAMKKGKGQANGHADEEDEGERMAEAHAQVGRRWVKRTLEAKGRTEAELARRLWDANSTAVLELCDDSFEEHVITTPAHWTGLHLHGLNHNTPHFSTASPSEVTVFADEFGFIPTRYVELQSLDEVKAFTDDIAQTGSWEGQQIEGFVVRCTVQDTGGKALEGKPPYRSGAPFFFKIKFDEPYLLYRKWREATRAMLPLLEPQTTAEEAAIWNKVGSRIKRPEVEVYAEWCWRMMKEEPDLFEKYERGVVRVRERFLTWIEGDGAQAWAAAKSGELSARTGVYREQNKRSERVGLPKKWMIVPVAVPGCGKTLIGLALTQLSEFGHTQSDDITAKRTAPTFLRNIAALFKQKDVVYADRNNHIDKHYNELADLANDKSLKSYDLRLIGILWDIDAQPYHRLLRICAERVVKRGDNHQTLRPDLTTEVKHEAVVGHFVRNWTPPDPAIFDEVIAVKVADSPRETLARIVDRLVVILGVPRPTDEAIDEALETAAAYRITTPYHAPAEVSKPFRYYGLAPGIDLEAVTETAIVSAPPDIAQSAKELFEEIKSLNRVITKLHVTLAHEKSVEAEREAAGEGSEPGPQEHCWNTCKSITEAKVSPMYAFSITHLVWDNRVMALVIDELRSKEEGPESALPEEVRMHLHVTLGTRTEEISAFESRGILKVAKEGMVRDERNGEADEVVVGGGKVRWIKIGIVQGEGKIRGMY